MIIYELKHKSLQFHSHLICLFCSINLYSHAEYDDDDEHEDMNERILCIKVKLHISSIQKEIFASSP